VLPETLNGNGGRFDKLSERDKIEKLSRIGCEPDRGTSDLSS
jgi:hypothetical protein